MTRRRDPAPTAAARTLLLLHRAHCAYAQFGNIEVKWDSQQTTGGSSGQRPRVATEPRLREFAPPEDVRRRGLAELPLETLMETVTSLGTECSECSTRGHWVSAVRSACLEVRTPTHTTPARALGRAALTHLRVRPQLPPKKLKAALIARGIKCEGCSSREHYLDRLLDSVHLPLKS